MTRADRLDEPVGALVRRLRKERGFTQAVLAAKAGCSRSLIQQIENGTRVPQLSLREKLSLALGTALPSNGSTGAARAIEHRHDQLRMRFNVLLGADAAAVERGLRLVERLLEAARAGEDAQPLREIALRQLDRAEDVLAQVPSRTATVWEWSTVRDMSTVVEHATRTVRMIHTASLGSISGDAGDDYHEALLRLAARPAPDRVDIRRIYVVDHISDMWPYEDRLWRLSRAGIENVIVKRDHAPNATGLLLVDRRFVVVGEYDAEPETRVASRISALPHDVVFAERRFQQLDRLKHTRSAFVADPLIADPPLAHYTDLDDADCRTHFRATLESAWDRLS
ncbi:helix-turn-helix domain-containing protein [Nocardia yamanashiensis]|uniref:helix-turn-helix domain-containing protein n=1 Tax=Nocardia yamanashiensis TaxID=209247 RepID=UPI00083315BF|nr:helix-turn-helix domain-containing protein [Nocardia yamanashiensis]